MSTNPWEADKVSVSHPTDRPNFSIVTIGDVSIGFSYRTAIHVSGPAGTATRENAWGPTTGKHLGYFADKDRRVSAEAFRRILDANLAAVAGVSA